LTELARHALDPFLAQTRAERMSRFAQHTQLIAAPGRRGELVAKFIESAEIQRDNADCELMLVAPHQTEPISST
jgi:hypothetical protein